MSTAKPIVIIECYDSGVRVCDDKNILAESASCALIESNSKIVVGEAAQQQAHLRPREVSTSYWSDLSAHSTTKHVISNAELALHHLKHVWQLANCADQNVIIITPASFDKHHLGLLLGICKKLSIEIVGIVCNATLAVSAPAENCKTIYLDLLQHRLLITELIQNEKGIELKPPSRIFNHGIQNFVDNCAKTVVGKFVTETRFDPLHIAKHEQQFFDKLPLWLNALIHSDNVTCELSIDDKRFTVNVNKHALQQANHSQFEEIASYLNVLFHDHEAIAIYCSSSCLQVFGLHQFLTSLPGCAIVQLDKVALAKQAIHCKQEIISKDKMLYINNLSWQEKKTTEALTFNPGKLSNLSSTPSHILIDGHAYDVQQAIFISSNTSAQLTITINKTPESLCKISLNGLHVVVEALKSQQVFINDNEVGVENIVSVSIGDHLCIKTSYANGQFIKVVKNEA